MLARDSMGFAYHRRLPKQGDPSPYGHPTRLVQVSWGQNESQVGYVDAGLAPLTKLLWQRDIVPFRMCEDIGRYAASSGKWRRTASLLLDVDSLCRLATYISSISPSVLRSKCVWDVSIGLPRDDYTEDDIAHADYQVSCYDVNVEMCFDAAWRQQLMRTLKVQPKSVEACTQLRVFREAVLSACQRGQLACQRSQLTPETVQVVRALLPAAWVKIVPCMPRHAIALELGGKECKILFGHVEPAGVPRELAAAFAIPAIERNEAEMCAHRSVTAYIHDGGAGPPGLFCNTARMAEAERWQRRVLTELYLALKAWLVVQDPKTQKPWQCLADLAADIGVEPCDPRQLAEMGLNHGVVPAEFNDFIHRLKKGSPQLHRLLVQATDGVLAEGCQNPAKLLMRTRKALGALWIQAQAAKSAKPSRLRKKPAVAAASRAHGVMKRINKRPASRRS